MPPMARLAGTRQVALVAGVAFHQACSSAKVPSIAPLWPAQPDSPLASLACSSQLGTGPTSEHAQRQAKPLALARPVQSPAAAPHWQPVGRLASAVRTARSTRFAGLVGKRRSEPIAVLGQPWVRAGVAAAVETVVPNSSSDDLAGHGLLHVRLLGAPSRGPLRPERQAGDGADHSRGQHLLRAGQKSSEACTCWAFPKEPPGLRRKCSDWPVAGLGLLGLNVVEIPDWSVGPWAGGQRVGSAAPASGTEGCFLATTIPGSHRPTAC
ncbi:uncharacterized protein B0I36DRAFT_352846 [Microdochium trichocladiopsis]|uniref:Uncharacterized protein n=1 Tax=Microdochium trichocladiopsis TaxID=1682393 RepID=A0A9P8XXI7_9PEZI|nr:uncharacterized protein B0I36DRAFT_352846 [Microdochium trichocladiopsis]KAH7024632.1 hypothetical protein B0I36DRAFT_352846 [Microdochium trichocladiopsis]